jgi:hypothetical protein
MYVKALKSKLRPDADQQELRDWLRKLAQDTKKSVLGQIINHAESQRYLFTLDAFELHFDYLPVYSISWVKTNLHHIGGGVRLTIMVAFVTFIACIGDGRHHRISREYLAVTALPRALLRDAGYREVGCL